MPDSTQNYLNSISEERLFGWHSALFPTGRIAKAITDLLLTRSENKRERFYSMSSQILVERKQYYEVLQKMQHSKSDMGKDCQMGSRYSFARYIRLIEKGILQQEHAGGRSTNYELKEF